MNNYGFAQKQISGYFIEISGLMQLTIQAQLDINCLLQKFPFAEMFGCEVACLQTTKLFGYWHEIACYPIVYFIVKFT